MRRVSRVCSLVISGFVFLFLTFAASSFATAQVDRPPQYVLLAFDGSSALSMWKATREFASRSRLQRAPVSFTYFISGVYYVSAANKKKYIEPTHGAGSSAIGWGSTDADILARYDQTNFAAQEKHEIASHANAHFDGSKWTFANWHDEFRQFHKIIFDFFGFNDVRPTATFPNGWVFSEKSMVGFRAPQLGVSEGLWETLRKFGYRYDTSKTSKSNYWPERNSKTGHWNFPLAGLTIAGTGKKTLSMDYNFYFADSKALPNPSGKSIYKKQMLETYLQYFENNYNGNRAPVHIGHHFSLWNDGAYWEAMQEFAIKVCGRPEVRCVTYSELADFMDSRTPAQLNAYQAGHFEKLPPVTVAEGIAPLDLDVRVATLPPWTGANASPSTALALRISGHDRRLSAGDKLEVRVNGTRLGVDSKGLLNNHDLRRRFAGQTVSIESRVLRMGHEIARATQSLSDVGGLNESVAAEVEEDRALLGDLPEAHVDENGLVDGGA